MNQRLDFLKFLTKQSNCKTLTNQQINVLWECLVVNAFSEEERDQFFIFCTEVVNAVQIHQHKLQQEALKANSANAAAAQDSILAGELLFDEDTLEMIFFEILLRLDFKGSEPGNSITQ